MLQNLSWSKIIHFVKRAHIKCQKIVYDSYFTPLVEISNFQQQEFPIQLITSTL